MKLIITTVFLLLYINVVLATLGPFDSILQLDNYFQSTLEAFDGLILEDFFAEPSTQSFNGSLAVGRTFLADGYMVNIRNRSEPAIQCINNTTSLDQIGLFVQGTVDAKNTTVNGAVITNTTLDKNDDTITSGCVGGAVSLDFQRLAHNAVNISQFLSRQVPNLVLRDGGYLSDGQYLGKDTEQFYTMTFCQAYCEALDSYLYSDPSEIFLGSSNWTGPYNTNYLTDKPIIFNIPVRSGSVFHMSTSNPAAGLEDASVIYNVYPTDERGNYDPSGYIVWIRDTTYTIGGFVLAPNVHLIESNVGGFTGNIVTSRYLSVQDINNEIIRFFTAKD